MSDLSGLSPDEPAVPRAQPASAWAPIRNRSFRWLWCGGAMVNLAIWMQTVGAAWIMTLLSTSPLMVSLVQTAISLPAFLFGLPGGVIADLVDRRKWLMMTQGVMLIAAAALSVLSSLDMLSDWSLLAFTFLLGTGSALSMSAWMVTIVSVLPRDQVPAAISLNGISTNAARALGPALAGGLIAYWNAASVFVIITVCLALVIVLVAAFTPRQTPHALPAENFAAGLRSGVRYIRHSAVLVSALKQVFIFTLSASALWALLPLVAKHELGMDAGGYGLLMGFLGAGAVAGALNLTAMYRRFPLRVLIIAGTAGFALATLVAALSHSRWAVCGTLMIAGMSWMAVNATISTVVQTCAANWVRARVASVYLLMLMGAMAIGGAIWGTLAEYLGLQNSLVLAAVTLGVGLILTRSGRLELGQEADYASAIQPTDRLLVPEQLNPGPGPVSIELAYRVAPEDRANFIAVAYAVGQSRRRNGAKNWRLYHDLDEDGHYVERFIVESWLDYLRQQSRTTQADQLLEARLSGMRCDAQISRRYIHQPLAGAPENN
ncbi:MFS transporter [Pseudomonas abietaniphila]|uniref:DitE n=1 Tax=Pseudomonas abietaniphila TaxID=89065 RepID=Q9X4X4_9PSED|nr:MFS transporter [Pseudomonas abietaniphila]AAD21067.1 DitE [Pseudomonas abietaniphila]SDG56997.1 Predicted arabinose efflux permease, MFS family [Pseudomonas abietaniphila]